MQLNQKLVGHNQEIKYVSELENTIQSERTKRDEAIPWLVLPCAVYRIRQNNRGGKLSWLEQK